MSTVKIAAVQSEPVWFDLDGTVAKTIELMAEASREGAELIAFPETWVPGYPSFMWFRDEEYREPFRARYRANSMVAGSEQHRRIERAAEELRINVLLGLSESDGRHLYMAQFFISSAGETLLMRRKLKPSGPEGDLFAGGSKEGLTVVETALGRLGALNCSENRRPLVRHTLLSMGQQIHVASWPHFGLYPDVRQMSAEVSMQATASYAAEGDVVTLAPTTIATDPYLDLLGLDDEERKRILTGCGATRIFGTTGELLAEPLDPDQDGLLYASVPRALINRESRFDREPLTAPPAPA